MVQHISSYTVMLQYQNLHIRTNTDTTTGRNLGRSEQENIQKSQIQQLQTHKFPQVERKYLYIGNLSKNSTRYSQIIWSQNNFYLSEKYFIEATENDEKDQPYDKDISIP